MRSGVMRSGSVDYRNMEIWAMESEWDIDLPSVEEVCRVPR